MRVLAICFVFDFEFQFEFEFDRFVCVYVCDLAATVESKSSSSYRRDSGLGQADSVWLRSMLKNKK